MVCHQSGVNIENIRTNRAEVLYHKDMQSEPKLAPPGAGLPLPGRWIAKWIVPLRSKRATWAESTALIEKTSLRIKALFEELDEKNLNRRVLVSKIFGLEDSSRYWSFGMTVDHLLITGNAFKFVVSELSHERVPDLEARTENVKPPQVIHTLEILNRYQQFSESLILEINQKIGNQRSKARFKHPWFGPLTASQWFWIIGVHQGIHLQQLRAIKKAMNPTGGS